MFKEDDYVYKTEDDVLSALEGSAGMLIYWARIEAPDNVSELYDNALYTEENDGKTINERSEAEAFVDWITIETNPSNAKHRGIEGKGNPIILLRNQAKFTIVSEGDGSDPDDEWKGDFFEVTGFTVCNTPAFGTVAPYHTNLGFPTYACSTFTPEYGVIDKDNDDKIVTLANWLDEKAVTLAARREKMSDIADVSIQRDYYIFETNNLGTDPVDLILRGKNIKNGVAEQERYYYRVNIIDNEGEMMRILRNHHYEIHIKDNLSNGCLTFNEALDAPPTNNIWISISDEVNSVRNNDYVLTVEKTKEVVETGAADGQPKMSELKLNFNIRALKENQVDPNKISVYWMEDEQKVSSTFNPSLVIGNKVTYDASTGDGVISLTMNKLMEGSDYERGSIVVKYGRLQRKIRILLMRTKEFIPTWVSSEVYGQVTADASSRSNVTVVFTIPETCPEELFPMDVLVTTNNLDGRAATGQILPIVRIGEEGYGKEFEINAPDGEKVTDLGYKYKLTVTEPGQHRLYFENILLKEDKGVEYVTLEAEHFEFMTKMVTYVEHQRKILLPKLSSYAINPGASEEEEVKYILVPQKRFTPVIFDIHLQESNGTTYATLSNEEFLFYSTNLDHYPDNDSRVPETGANSYYSFSKNDFDCYFKPYARNLWKTGGRIFGFYPRENKLENPSGFLDGDGCFQIYMETNKPHSAEVVRIASNQENSTSVISDRFLYWGKTFRSVTFELANYRPFRFAAQVNDEGNYVSDDATSGTQNPEVIDNIEFEYLPDEVVKVSFDVTSFHTTDSKGNMISVDPFGTAFEIFIDAPMLKLEKGMNKSISNNIFNNIYKGTDFEDIVVQMFDKTSEGVHYTESKPKLEDLGNGRFVYRVNALYYEEAAFWGADAPLIKDNYYNDSQSGERKTIYFKKNSIVSNGEITISANPNHVAYHSKTFKVSNSPIQGRIGYMPEGSTEPNQVPAGQFVSFARQYDGSRIGSLNVRSRDENLPDAATYYELRLRAEYEFSWVNDPILITCSIDGKYYSTTIPDLKTLYETPNKTIILQPMKDE